VSTPATPRERELLRRATARLRTGVLALVFGLVAGVGLAFATAWLLLRGGEVVGPHLGLLAQFYPGYTVSWPGVAVGFLYGLATGTLLGLIVGTVYNGIAERRDRRR
jgi:hypothetical protein